MSRGETATCEGVGKAEPAALSDSAVVTLLSMLSSLSIVELVWVPAFEVGGRGVAVLVTVGVTSFDAGKGIAAGAVDGEMTCSGDSGAVNAAGASFEEWVPLEAGEPEAWPLTGEGIVFLLGEKTYGFGSSATLSTLVFAGAADFTNALLRDDDGSFAPKKSSSRRLDGSLRDAEGVTCGSDAPNKSPEGCVVLEGDS